ncbi:MAG: dihydroneopterin aldolase [Rhodovibrionaceae bacterium]|nr:dihydroneopterin aldolase [Rhodovibrionaceae bacterium]
MSHKQARPPAVAPASDSKTTQQRILLRDLELECRIGWGDPERQAPQRLRFNVDIEVRPERPLNEDIARTMDYSGLVARIRSLCEGPPVKLLETLAERVADICLEDARAVSARVRVEKPDRYAEAAGIGIEITRKRP